MSRPPYSNIVSFSGGKDSTAMLLMMLERGEDVRDIVFFDTGWEFPEMYDHLEQVEAFTGRKITRLGPPEGRDFMYWLLDAEVRWGAKTPLAGQVRRVGNAWPSPSRRWCTRTKTRALDHYAKGMSQRLDVGKLCYCIGYGADECWRPEAAGHAKKRKAGARHWFPLIEWGVTEPDALVYCRERGFTWGGLYDRFHRVSCFCCPLQPLNNLRTLRRVRPELWATMLEWEMRMDQAQIIRFHHEASVHDLEVRFAAEYAAIAQARLAHHRQAEDKNIKQLSLIDN